MFVCVCISEIEPGSVVFAVFFVPCLCVFVYSEERPTTRHAVSRLSAQKDHQSDVERFQAQCAAIHTRYIVHGIAQSNCARFVTRPV